VPPKKSGRVEIQLNPRLFERHEQHHGGGFLIRRWLFRCRAFGHRSLIRWRQPDLYSSSSDGTTGGKPAVTKTMRSPILRRRLGADLSGTAACRAYSARLGLASRYGLPPMLSTLVLADVQSMPPERQAERQRASARSLSTLAFSRSERDSTSQATATAARWIPAEISAASTSTLQCGQDSCRRARALAWGSRTVMVSYAAP
jgi:hypothetical protein